MSSQNLPLVSFLPSFPRKKKGKKRRKTNLPIFVLDQFKAICHQVLFQLFFLYPPHLTSPSPPFFSSPLSSFPSLLVDNINFNFQLLFKAEM